MSNRSWARAARLFPGSMVLAWLACAPRPPVASTPQSHALWWSPALQLQSIGQIADALKRPFDAFDVTGPDGATARIESCTDYQRLRPSGYAPLDQPSFGALQEQGARCQSLALLQRGQPARDAQLRDLLARPDLLRLLPASVAPASSNDEIERRAAAGGQSWAAYDRTLRVLAQEAHSAELAYAHGKTQLELYALGDFDGDSSQDALVKGVSSGTEGTWFELRLWLFTRAPDGRLRVSQELAL